MLFLERKDSPTPEFFRIVSWMTGRLATHSVEKPSEDLRVILNVPCAVELATQPRHEITSIPPVIHPPGVGSAGRFFVKWRAFTVGTRPTYFIPLLKTVQGREGISRKISFIHLYSGCSFKNIAAIKS